MHCKPEVRTACLLSTREHRSAKPPPPPRSLLNPNPQSLKLCRMLCSSTLRPTVTASRMYPSFRPHHPQAHLLARLQASLLPRRRPNLCLFWSARLQPGHWRGRRSPRTRGGQSRRQCSQHIAAPSSAAAHPARICSLRQCSAHRASSPQLARPAVTPGSTRLL